MINGVRRAERGHKEHRRRDTARNVKTKSSPYFSYKVERRAVYMLHHANRIALVHDFIGIHISNGVTLLELREMQAYRDA